jgi:hypothetical protein
LQTNKQTNRQTDKPDGSRLTGRHSGVFQELSQVVHGNISVKDAKKYLKAQAMMTL